MSLQEYIQRCEREYKASIGYPESYTYLRGKPIKVHVPKETATNGVMIVGAYPSARFFTIGKAINVPLEDHDSPFSNEEYDDTGRTRCIPSGTELDQCILTEIGIRREECWITDLVKVFLFKEGHVDCYKDLNKEDIEANRDQFGEYAKKSIAWLAEEIALAKPYVVILLGAEVIATVLGCSKEKAKDHMTGQIITKTIESQSVNLLCFPHPGILMRKSVKKNPWHERFLKTIAPRAKEEIIKLKMSL